MGQHTFAADPPFPAGLPLNQPLTARLCDCNDNADRAVRVPDLLAYLKHAFAPLRFHASIIGTVSPNRKGRYIHLGGFNIGTFVR